MLRTNNLTIFLGCYHLRHHLQNHHVTGTLFVVTQMYKCCERWHRAGDSHIILFIYSL